MKVQKVTYAAPCSPQQVIASTVAVLRSNPGAHLVTVVIEPGPDGRTLSAFTTHNQCALANAGTALLQIATETDDCDCEECVAAAKRCKEALKIWDDVMPKSELN